MKKHLAFLLSILLCISLVPSEAFAVPKRVSIDKYNEQLVREQKWTEFLDSIKEKVNIFTEFIGSSFSVDENTAEDTLSSNLNNISETEETETPKLTEPMKPSRAEIEETEEITEETEIDTEDNQDDLKEEEDSESEETLDTSDWLKSYKFEESLDIEIVATDFEHAAIDDISDIEPVKVTITPVNQINKNIINILLLGLDAREYDEKSRSDTILIASYNKSTGEVKLVSFLRDMWINIPGVGNNRINAATVYGGPQLLINTINENFGLDIQDYIQIKFEDFKTVIDILGGIDIELSQAEIDYINSKQHVDDNVYDNDITSPAGIVHLNGAQALWQCRNRTLGSDFERAERQKEVISILLGMVKELKTTELVSLVKQCIPYVDSNITLGEMIKIAISTVFAPDFTIEKYRLPFDDTYQYASIKGASVITYDEEKNKELLMEALSYKHDIDPQIIITDTWYNFVTDS